MKKMADLDETPLPFSENDENEKQNGGCHQRGSNEITPRKRILGERNGLSSNPNSPEKSTISNPNKVSCASVGSEITSTNQFQVSPLNSSSSISKSDKKSTPYDPMTNYLSPRPEFLRYNPNRRREILLDLSSDVENHSDAEQGELSSCNASSSSISSSAPSVDLIKKEIDEVPEMEEEEDEEVESCKGLKWALKVLLILDLLFVSTVYISNMNSPTPPPAIKAIRDLRDDCQRVGGGLWKAAVFEMKKFHVIDEFHVGLFELSGYNATVDVQVPREMVVEDEDRDVDEENAVELGEVENDEKGDSDLVEGEENDGMAISNDMVVYESCNGILATETGSDEMSEKNGKIISREEVDEESESNETSEKNSIVRALVDEKSEDSDWNEDVSNQYLKDGIWVAIFSLLCVVVASVLIWFKKTSSKPPIMTELQEHKKRTPSRPPTPPRKSSVMPQVKLIGELDFGDDLTHPLSSFGSEDFTLDSASSYGDKISRKKEGRKQVATDMGLSSTPVRRSMRIRNRKPTSS